MAAVGGVFGARARAGSKLNTVYDADGNEIEVRRKEMIVNVNRVPLALEQAKTYIN